MKHNTQVSEIQVSYSPNLLVDMSIKNSKKSFELMLNVEKTVKMTTIFRFKMTTIFGAK